ncbi:MAG: transporter [Pirellulales bacterium]
MTHLHGLAAVGRWCLMAVCAAWMIGGMAATKGDDATSSREELETDRDSFTFAPTTAGTATSILESSYSFIDNRLGPETHSVPEVLVRRGIGEKVEARLGFNYEAGGSGTVSGSEFGGEDIETEEESRVVYGTKVETTDQDGWLPRSAAVLQGYTPVYGPSNKTTFVVGESFGWRFASGWEWTSAMRYGTGFEEKDSFNQWAPSSVVKMPVGERWSLHAEYFGIFTSEKETPLNIQYASFGGHVLATEDLEIGLRVGWGLNETTPAFFANLGVGLRY